MEIAFLTCLTVAPFQPMTCSITALLLKHVSDDFRSDLVYIYGTLSASLYCSLSLVVNFQSVSSIYFNS